MFLVDCPSGFCYLNSGMTLPVTISLVVFLEANIEQTIVKLFNSNYFMIEHVGVFVVGVEVCFCLCQNRNCFH